MNSKRFIPPEEVLAWASDSGSKKAFFPLSKTMMLSFLAGLFIALASVGSNMIAHAIPDIGLAKYLAGLIFPTGLILVVIAGAELYTGNNLIVISALDKKVSWKRFLYNLAWVWLGNLLGSVCIAFLINSSGQLDYSEGMLGAYTIKVAVLKTNLNFTQLFSSAILCNILVCLAVWMAYSAQDIAGKCLVLFFPIWLFIASGYEHSVANMYYISSALMAKTNPVYTSLAQNTYHISAEQLSNLSLKGMFIHNLIPVSLGNLVGGAFFIGAWYWWIYHKKTQHK